MTIGRTEKISLGFKSISLDYEAIEEIDRHGNVTKFRSVAEVETGGKIETVTIVDIYYVAN